MKHFKSWKDYQPTYYQHQPATWGIAISLVVIAGVVLMLNI